MERLLVQEVRRVSSRTSGFGTDCTSVLMAPSSVGIIRLRYFADRIGKALLATAMGELTVEVAFTPWIVGPSVLAAPQVMSGSGWSLALGRYTIVFDGPVAFPPLPGFSIMRSQRRPRL